jgi:hypothetical protein
MYKLIIKSAETGVVLRACVSNNENPMEYANQWLNENGLTPDKVIVDITTLRDESKQHYSNRDGNINS